MTTLGKEDNGGAASFEYGLNYWKFIPAILFGCSGRFPFTKKGYFEHSRFRQAACKDECRPVSFLPASLLGLCSSNRVWGCVALIGFGVVFLAINILSKPRFIRIQRDGIHCPSSLYSRKIYQIRKDDIVSVRQHDIFGQSSITIEHRAGKLSIPSMALKKGKLSEVHNALEKWIGS